MSFFSTVLKVVGIGAAVLSGVGALAAGASALGTLVGSTALASITVPISTSITAGIAAGASAISSVVTPVAGAVKAASDAANAINDQIVQPILQPLTSVINGVETLTQQIHNDLTNGLAGISQIPTQIAAALGSVDATFSRAAVALGATNSAIVETQLTPAMYRAGEAPLKALGDVFQTALVVAPGQIDRFKQFGLPHLVGESTLLKKMQAYEATIQDPHTIFEKIVADIYYGLNYLTAATATVLPDIEEIEQIAHMARPTKLLTVGDLIQAVYRGELNDADAMIEAQKQGIHAARYQILKELAKDSPATSTAAVWLAQGLITQVDYEKIAQVNAVPTADANLIYNGQFKPPSVSSMISVEGKERAAAAGFLAATLNQAPPSQLVDFYQSNLIDKRQATLDWIEHWNLPSMQWFIEAYFRGNRSHTDVINAGVAADVPAELVQDMIEVSRPKPRATMYKAMFDKGLIDVAKYQGILAQLGYSGEDQVLLVKLAQAEKPVTAATQYHELKTLSLATAEGLYTDGAIDGVQYEHVLIAHGYSPEAAKLQQQYTDIKHERSLRKLYADQLVADVALGNSTIDAALSLLHGEGFTDREVLRYQKQMTVKKAAAVKQPSISEAGMMFKRGIIDELRFRAFLTQQNFDPDWIDALVALELSTAPKPTKTV